MTCKISTLLTKILLWPPNFYFWLCIFQVFLWNTPIKGSQRKVGKVREADLEALQCNWKSEAVNWEIETFFRATKEPCVLGRRNRTAAALGPPPKLFLFIIAAVLSATPSSALSNHSCQTWRIIGAAGDRTWVSLMPGKCLTALLSRCPHCYLYISIICFSPNPKDFYFPSLHFMFLFLVKKRPKWIPRKDFLEILGDIGKWIIVFFPDKILNLNR